MFTVTAYADFSGDGAPQNIDLNDGATAGDLGAKLGAPPNTRYRVNGQSSNASTQLGEGDRVVMNVVKYDAGF